MKLFLTNDDGLEAKGLTALIEELATIGEIVVVAPEKERSAVSHSLTFFEPLRLKKVKSANKYEIYTTNGTPTDCVILGIKHILKDDRPDLIISGINHGANLGDDISYSGTVAAAREGTLQGIPSFGISLCRIGMDGNFGFAAKFAKKFSEKILINKIPKRTFFNVNVPDLPEEEITGVSMTVQGRSTYKSWIEESMDPRKRAMYWINSELPAGTINGNTDYRAIQEKKISITPIKLDLTDHNFIKRVPQKWDDILKNILKD